MLKEYMTGSHLLKFEARWCAPCKAMQPHLDALAGQFPGKYALARHDVEDDVDFANGLGVRAVPTLVAVKDGVVIGQQSGWPGVAATREFLKNTVGA